MRASASKEIRQLQGIGRECRRSTPDHNRQACKHRPDEPGQVERRDPELIAAMRRSVLPRATVRARKPASWLNATRRALEGSQGDIRSPMFI